MSINAYQILTADTASALEAQVHEYIKDGWQPLGGVSVTCSDFYSEDHKGYAKENQVIIFAQAMAKE